MEEATEEGRGGRDKPDLLPLVAGPQDYVPWTRRCRAAVDFGPAERGRMVKQSLDICEKKGVVGAGYIPKTYLTTCNANSKGLFAYYQYGRGRLHPDLPHARRRRLRLGRRSPE